MELPVHTQLDEHVSGSACAALGGGDKPLDFFNRFFAAWKSGQHFNGASTYDDKVALTASAIANRDLTDFFTRWGMT